MTFHSNLACQSIQNRNNTRQAAAECNPNNTGQSDTKDGKEYIKCKENHSQPVHHEEKELSIDICVLSLRIGHAIEWSD